MRSIEAEVAAEVAAERPGQETAEPAHQMSAPVDHLESCLLFLCRHYDLPTSPARLRVGLSGHGSGPFTVQDFFQAADYAGLAALLDKHPLEEVTRDNLPLVALLNGNRAVVLLRKMEADSSWVVYNPELGDTPVRMTSGELFVAYQGMAVIVRPRHRGMTDDGTVLPDGHWFSRAMVRNRWTYVQVLFAAFLINLLGIKMALFLMTVYDRVVPSLAFESLAALSSGILIAIGFEALVRTLRSKFLARAAQRADLVMGRDIFNHLIDMQMKSRRESTGAFTSTMRDFENLREFFTSATVLALVDLPFMLVFLLIIYVLGGWMVVIPLMTVPIVVAMSLIVQPMVARMTMASMEEGQTKLSVLVETLTGLETVKTTGVAPVMRKRWEDSLARQARIDRRGLLSNMISLHGTTVIIQLSQVSLIVYGVYLIATNQLSMGGLLASMMLTRRVMGPLRELAHTLQRINMARSAYKSVDQLMATPTEREEGRQYISRPRLAGKIEFRNVRFRYPDQTMDVLNGLSFTVQPGEKVAIVGRIGSGKSTVARLLVNLYTPDEGSVLVDDVDIRQIDPSELRDNIGIASQENWLFSGTVRLNIGAGMLRPTDEAILRAATISGIHDFVGQHPRGYDMAVRERGEGLSGGQRQSIVLARALVGDPPILLLDEPTSMMDANTEQAVMARLKDAMQGKTVLIITHRTSLLDFVDRVIVIDGGRVVASGPKSMIIKPAREPGAAR